jgi:hypothetical protein
MLFLKSKKTITMKKLSLFTLFVIINMAANAANIYVDNGITPSPSNNGLSWNKALEKLEDAISIANSGDIIRVAKGTYTAPNSGYILKNGVQILGGHPPAFANPIPDYFRNALRNPNTHPVRLIAPSSVFIANTFINNSTIVNGFIIGNQNCDGLTLAIPLAHYPHDFAAKFIDCDFDVRRYGIHIDNPTGKLSPQFINCDFNKSGPSGNYSAAVYVESAMGGFPTTPSVAPSFTGCDFHSFDNGVTLIAYYGLYSPYFEKCSFYDMLEHVFVTGRVQYGAGIGLLYGLTPVPCPTASEFRFTPTIKNSIFYNNGGIMDMSAYFRCTTADIATKFTSCTFYNNPGYIVPCFSMNNYSLGAQTLNTPDMIALELENCISYGNLSNGKLMEFGPAMGATIKNSMIEAATTNSNGTIIDPAYTSFYPHPTIHNVTDLGGTIFAQNPLFVNTSLTIPNLDLLAASPARNTGLNPSGPVPGPTTIATDYRGKIRINELIIDMGAYEYCATQNGCFPLTPNMPFRSAQSTPPSKVTVDVYPNPFTSQLKIKRSTDNSARIILNDLKGTQLLVVPFESYETELNLSDLSPGVYTIIIDDGISQTIKKIVKK